MKKHLFIGLATLIAPLFFVSSVAAVDLFDGCEGISGSTVCDEVKKPGDKREAAAGSASNIVNAFLYLIGAIAIIMIIYGGFRFLISRGDANAVQSAKNIVLYAVLGFAIALLAAVITNFIVGKL